MSHFSMNQQKAFLCIGLLSCVVGFSAAESRAATQGILDPYGEIYATSCPQLSLVVEGDQNKELSRTSAEVLQSCEQKIEGAATVIKRELKGKILNVYS